MKPLLIVAALGVALAGAVPATAQHTVVTKRTVIQRGPAHGAHGAHDRRVCRVDYRHHHRVRTCRTVRYR